MSTAERFPWNCFADPPESGEAFVELVRQCLPSLFRFVARPERDPVVMLVDLQDMRWRGLLGTLFGGPGHMYFFPEQLTVNTPDIKQEKPGPFYQPPTIDDRELKIGVYAADRESLILALCQIRGIPLAFIKQVQDKSPSGMFTVVFFLRRQLGTRYFSPDMETCQLPPNKPPTKEEETFERMRMAKSRGRLLRTLEDQRSLVAELSQLPGDFAVADGGDVFGFWIRDPGSESAMEHEIAITLAHLRSEKRVPAWLTGEEAIANVLQGNFDVKTFRDYPGCLVLLYQGDFEPTPQTPKKAPRIAAVQVFVEPPLAGPQSHLRVSACQRTSSRMRTRNWNCVENWFPMSTSGSLWKRSILSVSKIPRPDLSSPLGRSQRIGAPIMALVRQVPVTPFLLTSVVSLMIGIQAASIADNLSQWYDTVITTDPPQATGPATALTRIST